MSGKAYTMQEMRGIVAYITERKAYNEIKGRKMWMDFASSKMTTRTWQSLKETFLKRILPDIHNPYYKLTLHQIASFREGYDVEQRLNNKLEVREANEDTLTNGCKKNDEHVSESKTTEEEDKGEDPQISKVDRDSTETLVLNKCYESAEDIKRDLTSPVEEKKDLPTKKIRDMLEFEPMTPAAADVQKLIDDFGTDDEGSDGEPKMEIDLGANDQNCVNTNDLPITLSDSDSPTTAPNSKDDSTLQKSPSKNENTQIVKETTSVTNEKREAENKINNISNKETTKTDDTEENGAAVLNNSETIISTHSTLPDSILPNNQEELNKESELNTDIKLNKPKTLSLNKNGVKRKNRICSTTSEEHKAKKSKTKSAEKKEIDTKQNLAGTVVNGKVSNEKNENNQGDILNEKENISQVSENPCLKSVSLYDVQLSNNKNSETESSGDNLKSKNQKEEPNTSKNSANNVVILKSHSESGSTNSESCDRRNQGRPTITKRYRDKALANVFGFTSGAVRQRKSSYRKPSISHHQTYEMSDSSEWTSDTASEYVSPPRGRRNRQTRKYLKPKSARITSLEKNGGLFVVYNNKIYPLVKDGKIVKNHVNYISDDESDEASERWKMKYLEEKKKSAELQRLLNNVQEQKQIVAVRPSEATCSAQCSSLKNNQIVCVNSERNNKEPPKQEAVHEEKPVKIKFTKNNEEVQLEGPLSYITPALAQVMQLLNNVPAQGPTEVGHQQGPAETGPSNVTTNKESRPPSSIIAVSLDDDVQDKIDKLETEIFKEIEEKDKIENTEPDESNVTQRSALRRKAPSTSTNVSPSSAKKRRDPPQKDSQKDNSQTENAKERRQETADGEVEPASRTRRTTRTSAITDSVDDQNEKNVISRRSSTKKTVNKVEVQGTSKDIEEDSDIRYKFPSPTQGKYTKKTKKSQKNMNSTRNETLVSPCNLSYSSESMQGYQDSDISPAKIYIKKRRTSLSTAQRSRTQNRYSRTKSISIPELPLDYESSNSFQNPVQTVTFHNSSLSTEVYRSDSYALLVPINVKTSRDAAMIQKMENKENCNTNYSFSIQQKNDKINSNVTTQEHDGLSSSNVSLPTSPVLSIVENLSISRSLLTSVDDIQVNENDKPETFPTNQITLNDLMKSDPDVPMALMEQECRIDANHDDGINYHYNINIHNSLTPNYQFVVNKLGTVNIEDQTLSESVNTKLKNLILDSNKKSKGKVNITKNKESNDKDKLIQKGKKRSSTPRRRQTTRIKRNREPSIEEEHMETCSISRKSCPPVIQTNNLELIGNVNTNKMEPIINTPKDKKKKDIIKVKIIKPKDKAKTRKNRKSNESLKQIDINNANIELQEADNSIDLIHNHSETCLQAHECIADSVEIIENSHSIISVDSERSSKSCNVRMLNIDEKLAQELYCGDAQDGMGGYEEPSVMFPIVADTPTVFHTALEPLSSANSLLTEDLSIELPEPESKEKTQPQSSKWYLYSGDESANFVDINQNFTKDVGYGSNLNDLFPVTCAVPDLSTITEMSKENDVDTRSNLESPIHKI